MVRAALAALALVAAAVLAGCGGGGHRSAVRPVVRSTTTTTTAGVSPVEPGPVTARFGNGAATTSTTTASHPTVPATAPPTFPTSELQAALERLEAGLPVQRYAISGVQQAAGETFVVVARDISTRQSVIDVDVFQGGAFHSQVSGLGVAQNLDPVAPGTIKSAHVTPSPLPDFLILLQGNQSGAGVVLSAIGNSWHTLGLQDRTGPGASDELIEPQIEGPYVTQSIAVCSPNCNEGPYSVTTYGYDPTSGELAQVGPTMQSPTPG